MLKENKRNILLKELDSFIAAGKLAILIYLTCLFFLVFTAAMLAGALTKEVFIDVLGLAMVLTGAGLVLLGVINPLTSIATIFFGNVLSKMKEGSLKKITSGILICSVYAKTALVPLALSGIAFVVFLAMNDGLYKENILFGIVLMLVATGIALILLGTIGIFLEILKCAVSWLRTHKSTFVKYEVEER